MHVAVALDRLGRVLGSLELAVDERGFAALVRFAVRWGPAFAVEGTAARASLARCCCEGFAVYECERRAAQPKGKND